MDEPQIIETAAAEANNVVTFANKKELIPMSVLSPSTLALMQGGNYSQKRLHNDEIDGEGETTPTIQQKHQQYPSFGGVRKSSTGDESIQLSLNGTVDKYNSIEIVKQLHADGEIA